MTKLCDLNEDQAEEGSQQEEQVTSVCWTLSVRSVFLASLVPGLSCMLPCWLAASYSMECCVCRVRRGSLCFACCSDARARVEPSSACPLASSQGTVLAIGTKNGDVQLWDAHKAQHVGAACSLNHSCCVHHPLALCSSSALLAVGIVVLASHTVADLMPTSCFCDQLVACPRSALDQFLMP